MSTEHEALRLAEEGERRAKILRQEPPDWSAMLRKLVAEREADRAAMREALEAMLHVTDCTIQNAGSCTMMKIYTPAHVDAAITDLRQRLEGTT